VFLQKRQMFFLKTHLVMMLALTLNLALDIIVIWVDVTRPVFCAENNVIDQSALRRAFIFVIATYSIDSHTREQERWFH
jgi:hypothetical protein